MIPFPFHENRFSFFVADYLLVGQLCTNPKSDRSLLSCLKLTQCSASEIGDTLLYNSSSLVIQVMTTGPLQVPSKCKSGLQQITGTSPGWWKQGFGYGYGLWCDFKWGPHHTTSHLRSRLESQHQSVPGGAEECGDPLVQSGGRWQTLGVAAWLGAGSQVQRDLGLASEGVLPFSHCLLSPDLNPLDYFVWLYVENITNMTSHNTKASAEYSPSSRRRLWKRHAPSSGSVSRRWLRLKAATLNRCQLYYIIKLPELIFSIKVLK